MRVLRLAIGLGLAVAFASAFAHGARAAEGRTSSLSWLRMPGADECIATQALARAVEDRLGRPGKVFVSAAKADVSVEGRIERKASGAGWHATISIRDAQGALLGTRDLDRPDASCEAMNEPLAFVIAVMIDPEAAMARGSATSDAGAGSDSGSGSGSGSDSDSGSGSGSGPGSGSGSGSSSRPDAGPPPAPSAPPAAPRAPRPPWRFEGGGAATAAAGLTPSLAAGAGVYAILFPPGIPIGFRGFGTLFLPTTAEEDGARASFDMLYVGGSLCPTLRRRVNLMFCLGGQLGLLRPRAKTQGRGIAETVLPIWNALAELRASMTIVSPIGITAGVGGALPLLRSRVEYRSSSATGASEPATLFQVSPVAAMADVGVGFVFP